jgi:hypothetical protein
LPAQQIQTSEPNVNRLFSPGFTLRQQLKAKPNQSEHVFGYKRFLYIKMA